MKKVFKQTRRSHEEWTDDYNKEDFDWDIAYTDKLKESKKR